MIPDFLFNKYKVTDLSFLSIIKDVRVKSNKSNFDICVQAWNIFFIVWIDIYESVLHSELPCS